MADEDYENVNKSLKPKVKDNEYVNVMGNGEYQNVKKMAQKLEKSNYAVSNVLPK